MDPKVCSGCPAKESVVISQQLKSILSFKTSFFLGDARREASFGTYEGFLRAGMLFVVFNCSSYLANLNSLVRRVKSYY